MYVRRATTAKKKTVQKHLKQYELVSTKLPQTLSICFQFRGVKLLY